VISLQALNKEICMNIKKYKDIDDYISSNGFEVLTYKGKVHARFRYHYEYKKNGYRITENRYKEVSGAHYLELTKLLKKEIRKLTHFPFNWFFGILFSSLGLTLNDVGLIVLASLMTLLFLFSFVIDFIEYSNTKKVLKSKSVISKDRINWLFGGRVSLFKDELID
jgi:hypothetical protein